MNGREVQSKQTAVRVEDESQLREEDDLEEDEGEEKVHKIIKMENQFD